MKMKLTQEELDILVQTLMFSHTVSFNTKFEARMCGSILKEFVQKLMKKRIDLKEKTSVTLDDQTILVMNYVLPQLYPPTPFEQSVISNLITKLNQQCLSIS